KALSPFAFSESWNVFENTFEAALVVNSDIPNTTLVGAWVRSHNTHRDLGQFDEWTLGDDGAFMLTAAYAADTFNVTGTAYYLPDVEFSGEELYAIWVDSGFNVSDFNIGVQGGYAAVSDSSADDTYALGAKFGAKFDPITVGAALTWVNDGDIGIVNLANPYAQLEVNRVFGENALYTTSMLGSNVLFNFRDATTLSLNGSMTLPVGTLIALADYSDMGSDAIYEGNFYEAALAYNVALGDLDLTAGVVHQSINPDADDDMTNTLVRVVARYNCC
ncbi:MAG: hypothetical protein P8Y43_06415, partial [Sulfurovaceae bacterium]